jgi:hypothetical protein
MGTRSKTLTIDCNQCDKCIVNDDGKFTCTWGKGKPKIMTPKKGRGAIHCKLKGKK